MIAWPRSICACTASLRIAASLGAGCASEPHGSRAHTRFQAKLPSNGPASLGGKITAIVIEPPGAIVAPSAGAPSTPKGQGANTRWLVGEMATTLRKVAPAETSSPTVVPPKLATGDHLLRRA